MRITVALVCAIASVAFALLFDSWLRSKKGIGEENAKIYAVVKGRSRNFRSFQIFPVLASVIVISAAVGIGISWKQAAACLAGAVTAIVPITLGSASFSNGVTAAYNQAMSGDIRQSVRAGYRTGAVMGSWITGICLAVMSGAFLIFKTNTTLKYAACFALGAAIVTMIQHTGGEVYTSAYSMAVPARDFTDRTGAFVSAGSDFAGSYILAAVSVALLAEAGVAVSGVTGTFTAGSAARFPLLVYGAGIIGTVIGVLIHRAGIGNDLSKGTGAGSIAAGIITAAASVYISIVMLQLKVYAYSVFTGIAAAFIMSSVSRIFSSDSKIFINRYKTDRNLGKHSSVIFSLGSGMMSTAIYTAIIIAATAVSYMYARYYGIALCAVGMTAVFGSVSAVAGMASVTGSVSDIIASQTSETDETRAAANLLDTVSTRNLVSVKTYASATGCMSSLAALCALFYTSETETIDLLSLRVFCGILFGITAAFILSGMIISSVRITGRVALRDIGKNDDDTGATSAVRGALFPAIVAVALPTLVGLFIGVNALAGFITASVLTGYMIIICFANSGMHFENTAVQSLSSLLKMMAVFSVAFLPVFIKVGGFLFN